MQAARERDHDRHRAQRGRILGRGRLELIASHGVEGMTMRQLAAACDLNIATLYHYVGSKSDLLGAIVAQRHYDDGLRTLALPVDPALAPRERCRSFFTTLATAVARRAAGVAPAHRREPARRRRAPWPRPAGCPPCSEGAVDRWLGDLFPELARRPGRRRGPLGRVRPAPGRVPRGALLLGDDPGRLDRRAAALAAVLFPTP